MNRALEQRRPTRAPTLADRVNARVREMIDLHFDPEDGAAYWLERERAAGIHARREIHRFEDLALLGEMTPADLKRRPLLDYVPRALHGRKAGLIVAQTGGTTGPGAWTAYDERDFFAAFVDPFVAAAGALGFPTGGQWLFVGPSGPHVIGKVVRHLASAFGSPEPFAVDFDPRWAKKLPEGSFARQRYLAHVVDQGMAVVESQDVRVLFTTPPVLRALAGRMSDAQRDRIRGVHYGGLPITPEEMRAFQTGAFPNALHLSGYGNTLFGCCLELSSELGRPIDYFPHGERLVLEVVGEDGSPVSGSARGVVRFTRLDASMLIVRLRERDVAEPVPCPAHAVPGYGLGGVRNPHTPAADVPAAATGIY